MVVSPVDNDHGSLKDMLIVWSHILSCAYVGSYPLSVARMSVSNLFSLIHATSNSNARVLTNLDGGLQLW
jgi:hypothetical protein